MPVAALSDEAPVYERPWTKTELQETVAPEAVPAPNSALGALECLMGPPRSPRAAGSGSSTTTR